MVEDDVSVHDLGERPSANDGDPISNGGDGDEALAEGENVDTDGDDPPIEVVGEPILLSDALGERP